MIRRSLLSSRDAIFNKFYIKNNLFYLFFFCFFICLFYTVSNKVRNNIFIHNVSHQNAYCINLLCIYESINIQLTIEWGFDILSFFEGTSGSSTGFSTVKTWTFFSYSIQNYYVIPSNIRECVCIIPDYQIWLLL